MTTMHDDTNPMAEILLKSELDAVAGGSLPPVISYVDDGATQRSTKRPGLADYSGDGLQSRWSEFISPTDGQTEFTNTQSMKSR